MNLFGRKKKKVVPKISDSIQRLRIAQETLDKTEAHLNKQIAQCLVEAKKKSRAKDKRGALYHLKKKKMYQKQVDQIYGKKTNLDIQIMALENAASNKLMADAMVAGRNALQANVSDAQLDEVADVMDDINESIQVSDEFGEALSQQIGAPMDEDDLLGELDELEDEMADDDIMALDAPVVPLGKQAEPQLDLGPDIAVPSGPIAAPAMTEEEREAEEFRKLSEEMGMI